MGEKVTKAKRFFLSAILLSLIFLLVGCNTISGASKGAAEGAKEDYEAAKKADDWMRKNLW